MKNTPENRAKAFICYSRKDEDFALRLAADLRTRGVGIWMDQLDIRDGANWDDEVDSALAVTQTTLVLLSPNSVTSEHVKDELAAALEDRDTVIPLMLQDCRVPHRILRKQRVDFRPADKYESALDQLCLALKDRGGRASAPLAAPAPPVPPPISQAPRSGAKIAVLVACGLLLVAVAAALLLDPGEDYTDEDWSEEALFEIVFAFESGDLPDRDQLSELLCPDLRKARNLPFARHGKAFKSPDLEEFFSGFDWYEPEEGKPVPCEHLGPLEQRAFHLVEQEQCSRCPDFLNTDRCARLDASDPCSS